jgi:DNA transformation protein
MSQFVDHVVELMAGWAPVRARRMFGGHGLYRDAKMFALIADDMLYLKIDAATRQRFAEAGSAPFIYGGGGRRIEMSYWQAPDACLEEPAVMCAWCTLAWEVACRTATAAAPRKPAQPEKQAKPKRRRSR